MPSPLRRALRSGAWGGIHICGYAHTNAEGGTGSSEIGNATYGGNDDADNSGTLRYIRLEYTGFAFDEEHEANGISFYGVGNGTTVDHCQAYKGSDDGFEFFGGSVNVSNMVVTDCSDDSFDWTEGWNGRGTNLVAVQESEDVLGYACDCLIEADNNENNNQATPIANPELSNLILVGSGSDTEGVRLRRGTYVRMDNAKICGKGLPLVVESTYTEQALLNGTDGAHISNTQLSGNISSENGIYTSTEFQADGNKTYQNISYPTYDDVLAECSWMAGWTRSWGTTSTEAPEEISGTVTENMTLVEGKTYRLNGAVTVEAGATLTIQPGVRVVAVNEVPGAASTSAATPTPTPRAARAAPKLATPPTAATTTPTTRARCATSASNTRATPSTRSTRPTASPSTAWATAPPWTTARLTRVPTTVLNSSAAPST